MMEICRCECGYQIIRQGVVLARPLTLDGRGRCPRCGRWWQLPVEVTVKVGVNAQERDEPTDLEGLVVHRGRGRPRKY